MWVYFSEETMCADVRPQNHFVIIIILNLVIIFVQTRLGRKIKTLYSIKFFYSVNSNRDSIVCRKPTASELCFQQRSAKSVKSKPPWSSVMPGVSIGRVSHLSEISLNTLWLSVASLWLKCSSAWGNTGHHCVTIWRMNWSHLYAQWHHVLDTAINKELHAHIIS